MNDAQADGVASAEGSRPTRGARGRGVWNRLLFEGDPNDGTPVQFGIRAVLWLQASAAGALSLLMVLDVLGAFILFIGTVLVMFWRVSPEAARARRVAADLLAGTLMPIICLVFDPGILRDSEWGGVIPAILVQIAALLVWQLMPSGLPALSAFFAGILLVGCLLATVIGICMLPMTLIGILLLVGFLGTMPFLTAIVYLRNAISAGQAAFGHSVASVPVAMFLLGLVVALGAPVFLSAGYGQEVLHYLRSLPNFGLRWL